MNPMLNQEEFELIERFLEEKLEKDQMVLIRKRIESDQDFASLVDEIREMQLGVQRVALAEKLDSFHADITEQKEFKPIHSIRPLWFWSVAASLFLVMTAGIWWIIGQESPEEKLYQAYFSADPGLVTSMASEGNYEFDRAMVDYKDGNYANAISRWEKLLVEKPKNDTLNYFLGTALLSAKQDRKSVDFLESVAKDSSSGFYSDANWYLGLAYLKLGEKEKALNYLSASLRPEAEKLISELEMK